MTEEETQAELAAKAEVEAKAEAEAQDAKFEESIADLSDEEKEAKRAEKAEKGTLKTDYSAEIEKELAISEEGRIKAEKALADKRFKTSEDKRNKNTDVEEEEKPITKAELSSFLAENEQKNKKVIEKQQADTLADRLAGSEDEKKLILAKWENRTFPANYSLEEQIKESYVLANGNKLIAERNEALRALKGKEVVNRDSSEAHIKPMPTKEREVSGDIKTVIGRRGFVFNNQTKQYEKTTANGKRLIYDKKTGAVYPEGHKFA